MQERRHPPLSKRERELIRLAGEGFTDQAIAQKLGIRHPTVSTYWGRIRIKMGPYSRTELVGMIIRAEAEATVVDLRAKVQRLGDQLRSKIAGGESGELHFELLQNAPEAVLVVSDEGEIEIANQELCRLFGYAPEELLGHHLSILIPERLRKTHRDHVESYTRRPSRRPMGEHLDTLALKADGTEFPIAAALNLVAFEGRSHVVCMLHDQVGLKLLQSALTREPTNQFA